MNLSRVAADHIGKTHADLLSRAAAFLLLKDSKASYTIEGEAPPHNRIERWSRIIGEAGQRELSVEELERLQSIVIVDNRFTRPGCRVDGGFVGNHERATGMLMPAHISARAEGLPNLLSGLMETYRLLNESDYDAVLAATLIAFGFVFIHPFEDGNGRIHRYLFHHVLAEKKLRARGAGVSGLRGHPGANWRVPESAGTLLPAQVRSDRMAADRQGQRRGCE